MNRGLRDGTGMEQQSGLLFRLFHKNAQKHLKRAVNES